MDIEERLAQYKRDGYTVFAGGHSAEIVEALRMEADRLQSLRREEAVAEFYSDLDRFSNDRSWWFDEMVDRAPGVVWVAVANAEIVGFAERVVGPFVQLDNPSMAKFPSMTAQEAGGKVTAWHRDSWSSVPIGAYQRPLAMNAISYLQDMTEALGLLRVLPASHIQPLVIDDEEKYHSHPDEVLLYLKAGDVVFTHHGVYHTGTPNTSGRDRYFFACSYNLTWMRQHCCVTGPNCRQIVDWARERGDRRSLRLLGIDDLLLKRANTGSHLEDEEYWQRWAEEDREALRE